MFNLLLSTVLSRTQDLNLYCVIFFLPIYREKILGTGRILSVIVTYVIRATMISIIKINACTVFFTLRTSNYTYKNVQKWVFSESYRTDEDVTNVKI